MMNLDRNYGRKKMIRGERLKWVEEAILLGRMMIQEEKISGKKKKLEVTESADRAARARTQNG